MDAKLILVHHHTQQHAHHAAALCMTHSCIQMDGMDGLWVIYDGMIWYGMIGWSHCAVLNCSLSHHCRGDHCCSTANIQLLKTFDTMMKKINVEYMVGFGTLLGAVRRY